MVCEGALVAFLGWAAIATPVGRGVHFTTRTIIHTSLPFLGVSPLLHGPIGLARVRATARVRLLFFVGLVLVGFRPTPLPPPRNWCGLYAGALAIGRAVIVCVSRKQPCTDPMALGCGPLVVGGEGRVWGVASLGWVGPDRHTCARTLAGPCPRPCCSPVGAVCGLQAAFVCPRDGTVWAAVWGRCHTSTPHSKS
jgi:hypothetical protein